MTKTEIQTGTMNQKTGGPPATRGKGEELTQGLLNTPREAICEWCGSAFTTRNVSLAVCSEECRRKRDSHQSAERKRRKRKDRAEGLPVCGYHEEYYSSSITDEERVALRLPIPKPGRIPCLRCQRMFDSKDTTNNRICKSCKSHNVMAYDPIVEGW